MRTFYIDVRPNPNNRGFGDSHRKQIEHSPTRSQQRLKLKGIYKLGLCDSSRKPVSGTFEYHIKQVEMDFWGNRFKVYDEWKERYWRQYQKQGYFRMLTGFICKGLYNRKEVPGKSLQGLGSQSAEGVFQ